MPRTSQPMAKRVSRDLVFTIVLSWCHAARQYVSKLETPQCAVWGLEAFFWTPTPSRQIDSFRGRIPLLIGT